MDHNGRNSRQGWVGTWPKSLRHRVTDPTHHAFFAGDQSGQPADGRVLTSNNGYWICTSRVPKMDIVQSVLDSVRQVVEPASAILIDAVGRKGLVQDLAGGLHLPGLNGQSVQGHIEKHWRKYLDVKNRIAALETAVVPAQKSYVDLVKDLGVDAWAEEDCTSAVQVALNKMHNEPNGPKILYIPAGRFVMNRITPRSGVSIIGAGRFLTTLLPTTFRALFEWRNMGAGGLKYLEDCVFADFGVDAIDQTLLNGQYTVQSKAFYFQRFRRCVFTRLYIRDTGATSIGIDYAENSLITDNIVVRGGRLAAYGDPGASCIGIGTGKAPDEPLIIANNICIDAKNYNIFVEAQGNGPDDYTPTGTLVTGNICIGGSHGFGECGCDSTVVTGNIFKGARLAGVILHSGTVGAARPGSRTLFTDNQISDAGGAGIEWHGVSRLLKGYTARGNRISNCGGAGHRIRGASNATLDDFQINDTITGCGGSGVLFEEGVFTNVDIGGRMMDNTGPAIRLDADIHGGSIAAIMRDVRDVPTQTGSIEGSGKLTSVMINGCQSVGGAPMDLTNPDNDLQIGFNPGVIA